MKQDKINKSFDALRIYIQKHSDLKDEEFELVSSLFTPVTIKRNHFILREGEICRYGYFVVKGTLRLYSIDKKGEEHIIQFALNLGSQKSRIALQERVTNFLSMTAEEKYLFMINKYPDIINRVPQRHIASFLGITPESLSRVRKNLSKNRS